MVIIDYGLGNVGSILNMLKYIGVPAQVSSDPFVIYNAKKLILPGVGAFDEGMKNIGTNNLTKVLNDVVLNRKVPILGICLGMQLLGKSSEEGILQGLNWINFRSVKFSTEQNERLKVPHMGWDTVNALKESPLLNGFNKKYRFYFVHTYHAVCENSADALLETDYGYSFISAVNRDNIYGVQFHPEKSRIFGMQLLDNFVKLC